MGFLDNIHSLKTFICAFHPIIVIETVEEERVEALLREVVKDLHMPLFEWTVNLGLAPTPGTKYAPRTNDYARPGANKPIAFENTADPLDVLKYMGQIERNGIFWLKDFAPHLEDPKVIREVRELAEIYGVVNSAMVLTGESITLPKAIAHDAVYFELTLPDGDELYQTLSEVMRELKVRHKLAITLQGEELNQFVHALSGMTLKQARQAIAYAALIDGELNGADILKVIHRKAQILREESLLELFPVEENTAKLGGFVGLKQWLKRAQVGFSSAAKRVNLPAPKGILIVGVQGCGKSLAAKTIAREWQLPLLKLDAGRLYNKFVGESEKNFRQAIKLAESMAPAVLWIDEIEKSFGNPSGEGDGGLSLRLFGSFLTWLQEKSQEVFVVATANDLLQLPPELLRKGRFDEIFFVDLPNAQERAAIFSIHLARHRQNVQDFDLRILVTAAAGYSGAEIEQAIIAGLYQALYAQTPLTTDALVAQMKSTVPLSVSRREDVEKLRAIASERFVSAR
ncbi:MULTISPECIES: AAA family ATPase [unclassified Picosynechococcus]|uniref:AAA family ATPase n=1 Tax=unclassified Picosynechococcus TaxID=3079910 RepID=UPI0004AA5BD9|nr:MULTISPECIES: AAA family ATPase [unclassified Picosynechococcus]ANV89175.1 AAA family ATPase [Picosynechococcus sp. PCC 8807]QCS48684.1 AAA family ATPase [Picosynechococcus sp. PCC 11901]